jgi:hypothetical protein
MWPRAVCCSTRRASGGSSAFRRRKGPCRRRPPAPRGRGGWPPHPPGPGPAGSSGWSAADRYQRHPLQLLPPALTKALLQQLGGVPHGFAAAEGDRIHPARRQGGGGGGRQRLRAAGFIRRPPPPPAPRPLQTPRASRVRPPLCTRGSSSRSPQPDTGKWSIRLSATNWGAARNRPAPPGLELRRGFAAHRCDFQAPGADGPGPNPAAGSRCSTASTPLALDTTSQWNSSSSARASSRGPSCPVGRSPGPAGRAPWRRPARTAAAPPPGAARRGVAAIVRPSRGIAMVQASSSTSAPACWCRWRASSSRPSCASSVMAWRKLLQGPLDVAPQQQGHRQVLLGSGWLGAPRRASAVGLQGLAGRLARCDQPPGCASPGRCSGATAVARWQNSSASWGLPAPAAGPPG